MNKKKQSPLLAYLKQETGSGDLFLNAFKCNHIFILQQAKVHLIASIDTLASKQKYINL